MVCALYALPLVRCCLLTRLLLAAYAVSSTCGWETLRQPCSPSRSCTHCCLTSQRCGCGPFAGAHICGGCLPHSDGQLLVLPLQSQHQVLSSHCKLKLAADYLRDCSALTCAPVPAGGALPFTGGGHVWRQCCCHPLAGGADQLSASRPWRVVQAGRHLPQVKP